MRKPFVERTTPPNHAPPVADYRLQQSFTVRSHFIAQRQRLLSDYPTAITQGVNRSAQPYGKAYALSYRAVLLSNIKALGVIYESLENRSVNRVLVTCLGCHHPGRIGRVLRRSHCNIRFVDLRGCTSDRLDKVRQALKLPTIKPRLQVLKTAPMQVLSTDRMRGSAAVTRRRRWLDRHPLCVMCEQEGRVTAGDVVDHIIPLWMGGKDDDGNLQTLCQVPHHEAKSKEESAQRARGHAMH